MVNVDRLVGHYANERCLSSADLFEGHHGSVNLIEVRALSDFSEEEGAEPAQVELNLQMQSSVFVVLGNCAEQIGVQFRGSGTVVQAWRARDKERLPWLTIETTRVNELLEGLSKLLLKLLFGRRLDVLASHGGCKHLSHLDHWNVKVFNLEFLILFISLQRWHRLLHCPSCWIEVFNPFLCYSFHKIVKLLTRLRSIHLGVTL